MLLRRPSRKRQQRDIARLLDGCRQTVLMRRAHAGQAPRHDFAALGDELPEHAVVLVVDVLDLLDAEFTNFLTPEKLASTAAFARRSARPASTTTAAKPGTISAGSISARTRPLTRCRLLCCSCLFSHNS